MIMQGLCERIDIFVEPSHKFGGKYGLVKINVSVARS